MDHDMVRYLAKLAKLNFTDEELEQAVSDMTSIIEIMDTIKEIDITYDPLKDNHNVYLKDLRKDEAKPSLPTEKLCGAYQQNKKYNDCNYDKYGHLRISVLFGRDIGEQSIEILPDVTGEGREIVNALKTEAAQENGGRPVCDRSSGNVKPARFFKEIFLNK